jgi:alcohol dehydrogenase (cytochrome c)
LRKHRNRPLTSHRRLRTIHRRGYPRGISSAGVLTTDTDLTITGDAGGNLLALRSTDGKVVWHENIGRMGGAPATVELDGKQYLLVTGGNSLFAYALP